MLGGCISPGLGGAGTDDGGCCVAHIGHIRGRLQLLQLLAEVLVGALQFAALAGLDPLLHLLSHRTHTQRHRSYSDTGLALAGTYIWIICRVDNDKV